MRGTSSRNADATSLGHVTSLLASIMLLTSNLVDDNTKYLITYSRDPSGISLCHITPCWTVVT